MTPHPHQRRTQPANGGAVLLRSMARALRPKQRISVSQWADAHRVLSPKASAEPGRWHTARTPHLREILDSLSESSPVREVVFMSSTQVGKTETGLNWLAYIIEHVPGPILCVVPTLQVRKRWKKQRLDPLLTDTPALSTLVSAGKARDGSNTEEIIDFPGGLLVLGGANSAASLASMPIRYVIEDELDRFPWDTGEGDPSGLIAERQKTFRRRKRLQASTPTVEGASRIAERYQISDRRRYRVPCPQCDEYILLEWEQVQWDKALTRAWMVCSECGGEILEHHKPAMLRRGEWRAENPGAEIRGYWINALYAPLGLGDTWLELVREYHQCKDDHVTLKRFTNTKLGRPWKDKTRDIRPNVLLERAEDYRLRQVPEGCLILTAGVDTQDDRLECQIVGWGRKESCWILDYLVIPGDPAYDEPWKRLTEHLAKPLTNVHGHELRVSATAIDSGGHRTQDVYNYQRSAKLPRVMACKSHNVPNKSILAGRPRHQDFNWRGRIERRGAALWMIGSDTAKHKLYARLSGDSEHDDPLKRMVHFPADLGPEYYDGLTAELFDPERNRWVVRRGRRNEPLDTWVLAYAAAHHPHLRVHAMRAKDWDRLAQGMVPAAAAQADGAAAGPAAPASRATQKPKEIRIGSRREIDR